ncbi:MAG TPA: TadE/TadG family type IV pilus assembly protein [Candidatus Limnocylindria bacterium]|nr:TadE/TadG family type IV pilus assembly protein [Candidatus Limnocylindria bacterium]
MSWILGGRTRVRPRGRRNGGQSLVEFALIFPLIVFLIASFVEVGRAVFAYNTIANAARQGARVAIVNQLEDVTDCDASRPVEDPFEPHWSIRGCVIAAASTLGLTTDNVTIAYNPPTATTLDCDPTLRVGCVASITVTYDYSVSTPFLSMVIGSITMTQTSQMPIERVFP